MESYRTSKDNILKELDTDPITGLNDVEAAERLKKYGENKLKEKKKKTKLMCFCDQFKDIMILILIAAAAVSFIIACTEGDLHGFFEPVLILCIVIINAIMGVVQESKTEKALEALKNMSAPHARAVRNGKEHIIDASQLVIGDIIKLEAGDFVPTDARLLESVSLKCEESVLTGESVPTEKDANIEVAENSPIGDKCNMVFSGCSVTYGTATAVVTQTGMDTQIGKIANLLDNESETQTPLQEKLAQLGKYLSVLALAACAVIFVVGLLNDIPLLEIFMTSVSLAVSAIPEGLPAIVTIVLSIGVQRMVKRNALVRRLPAVETLGSASVICSDKTGTLTQNRMTLVKTYCDGETTSVDFSSAADAKTKKLIKYATLCCDGSISVENGETKHIGDPTETAIVYAAHILGFEKPTLAAENPRQAKLPFDSDRKLMTTVNTIDGKNIVIVKGAFDVMEKLCTSGCLTEAKKSVEKMSADALRVLAVGYKEIDKIPNLPTSDMLECGLTFMGLVGMADPPRPEAKEAVKICKKAGIKPIMITGDHITTASAIARELGILNECELAITGAELDAMSNSELEAIIKKISVYARVSPENKIRIVKAWQKKGHVVSMTGDGVNDAPALKAADIGCAMGITGTDVAKSAADMTLTDDNFATIVEAIKNGRGIYANICKVVEFLLGTNIGEVVAVFLAMILWHKTPFLSMQLLWINLATDSLPAIALGMEPVEKDVMDKKPKPKNESIFSHGLGIRVILQGFMFAVLSLIGFRLGETVTGTLAGGQTMAFMVLALSQTIQAFNMRSDKSLFKIGIFTNKKLNVAVLISVLMITVILFTPIGIAFGLVILPIKLYIAALVLILVPIVVIELSKAISSIRR